MAKVKNAGSTEMRENPPVHSKGYTFHGKPHSPQKVSTPGKTVPLTGSTVAGHTSSGHRVPREVAYHKDEGRTVNPGPRMSGTLHKADSAKLDRVSYTGKYPGDK